MFQRDLRPRIRARVEESVNIRSDAANGSTLLSIFLPTVEVFMVLLRLTQALRETEGLRFERNRLD